MKYWRRVAVFVLKDEKGKILLQHKDSNAPRLPNSWALFGGGIEKDETPKEAVMREAEEELQIKPKLKFFKKYDLKHKSKNIELFLFIGKLEKSIEELKKLQLEGDSLDLFSREDLRNIKLWSGDEKILKDIFENKL